MLEGDVLSYRAYYQTHKSLPNWGSHTDSIPLPLGHPIRYPARLLIMKDIQRLKYTGNRHPHFRPEEQEIFHHCQINYPRRLGMSPSHIRMQENLPYFFRYFWISPATAGQSLSSKYNIRLRYLKFSTLSIRWSCYLNSVPAST